jgi:uncharacterized membrane protein
MIVLYGKEQTMIIEKIYVTWLILALPVAICSWIFFIDNADKHPTLYNILIAFVTLPVAIGFIAWLIWGIIQVWMG